MIERYVSQIKTSNYSEHVELRISGRILEFISRPWYDQFDVIQIIINNEKKEYLNQAVTRDMRFIKLPRMPNGRYALNLYVKSSAAIAGNLFLGMCSIRIEVSKDNYNIIRPYSYQRNLDFLNGIPCEPGDLSRYKIATKDIQCFDTDIIQLSKKICGFSHNGYNKLLCIHDWIGENMFYDEDSLNNKSYMTDHHSALKALKCDKSCVCSDFTLLTVAMARAQNIPSIGICCKTVSDDLWWEIDPRTVDADHIFAAAWVDNRWVLMDNTWDCVHKISNGVFKKNFVGYKRQYFDITLDVLSSTHRFVEIYR